MKELPGTEVVTSARDGDRDALDELVAGYLPLVYNIVGRAADRDLDVDDIVQETMLHLVTGLAGLRHPERLRAWVVSIALRELSDARSRAARTRVTLESELPDRSDPAADFEGGVLLRQALTFEQQEVARATTWLDPAHREVLALWWFEQCGELSRNEVADALDESLSHVAVRIQRMREQLDTARTVVRALNARPLCEQLAEVVAGWDGKPSPLWRKRIARHLRNCPTCSLYSQRLVAPERLLAGLPLALLPKPLAGKVLAAVATRSGAAVAAGTATAPAGLQVAAVVAKPGLIAGLSAKAVAVAAAVLVAVGGGAVAYVQAGAEKPAGTAGPSTTLPAPAGPVPVRSQPALPAPAPSEAGSPTSTAAAGAARLAPFFPAVPAFPRSSAAKDLGAIRQNARVGGRDGGQSAAIGGKSVWIFADTTLKDPWGFLSNSAAVTTDLKAADGIDLRSGNGFSVRPTQVPVELIPRTAAEKAFEKQHSSANCAGSADQLCGAIFGFWPGPVVADPARHRVLFTYGKLCRGGQDGTFCSGPLGKGLGMGIGALDVRTGQVTRLTATGASVTSVEGADRSLFFGPGAVNFGGAAAVVRGDDVYLYGGCQIHGCKVARAPLAQLTSVAAWRYYDGKAFGGDPGKAAYLIAPGAAGQTVFYSPGLKAWLNVFMPYGENTVKYQVGGSPFGPWSAESRTIMQTSGGTSKNYSLYGHAEYAERGGLVQYLSYFNPNTGAQHLIRWQTAR